MYAKKSLGQNFLKSERALDAIVRAGELSRGDTVLEIGPGQGALTEKLLATSCKVVAVEKDDNLYEYLGEKFKMKVENGQFTLIHGDILDFDPAQLGSYKLIANIPYNITGAILEKFLSGERKPSLMVLLVQKEVAERIVARDGKESILSLSVKAYGKPEFIEKVPAGAFVPAPKVDSAIIKIESISHHFFTDFSETAFFNMIHAGFKAKRKKLMSNLAAIFDKEAVKNAFNELNLDENTRAEEVSIEIWQKLALLLKN